MLSKATGPTVHLQVVGGQTIGAQGAGGKGDRTVRDLDWLRRAHEEQLALCAELEEIADSLPSAINRQKCIYAAKALGPLIQGIHRYEESILFPQLQADPRAGTQIDATLERLKFEHCEDECFAEELTDALLKLGSGDRVNMEAIGYMLRGFFEGIRRHIAFEREYLFRDMQDDASPSTP